MSVSVLGAFPGRVTLGVRVPPAILAEAEDIAAKRGVAVALVLGDLAASVLPDALADAAREILSPETTNPRPESGAVSGLSSQTIAVLSIPAGRSETEPVGDATA